MVFEKTWHEQIKKIPQGLLMALVYGYRYTLSPLMGTQKCRFVPTCSQYALESLKQHGALKGSVLSIKRILRCHPWYHGNISDPVPASIDWADLMGYNPHRCCGRDNPRNTHNKSEKQ